MDRDQEKFYEDEEQEVRAEAQQPDMMDGMNDMRYFLELLKHIRAAIQSGSNLPLSNKKIIDARECLMIIDDMERNLPDAVQYGMQMFAERDRILGNAEKAAMNRVSSAEMRANAGCNAVSSSLFSCESILSRVKRSPILPASSR